MHELKGVLFVDSAVFQVNVLTQQREVRVETDNYSMKLNFPF